MSADEDYAAAAIRQGSKSFSAAARLFDASSRESVTLLYAWCRHCDDQVDGQDLGHGAQRMSRTEAVARLDALYVQTRQACAEAPVDSPPFRALRTVARRHRLPEQLALAHLDGYAMDVRGTVYETFEDTLRYCYGVAGVVGLMMCQVMGASGRDALDRACDLGLAFQLTNIARDLVEDAQVGRCYLPRRWLQEQRLAQSDLGARQHRDRLAALAARLVDAAEPYYASALQGLPALPFRSAWAVASAHGVYRQIGIQVKRRGARAWDSRVRTSTPTKLRLMLGGLGRALVSRWARAAPRPDGLWQRPPGWRLG